MFIVFKLSVVLISIMLSYNVTWAGEADFIDLGKSVNRNWILSYDQKGVEKAKDEERYSVLVRLVLSDEGIKAFRESFESSVKEAEEKAGSKVEHKDDLFETLVKAEQQLYYYHIDCKAKEYKRTPAGGGGGFVQVFKIKEGTAEEALYNKLCKGSDTKDNTQK